MLAMLISLLAAAPAAWSAEVVVSGPVDDRPASPAATQLQGAALLVAWESPGEGLVARRMTPAGQPYGDRVLLVADVAPPGVPFDGRVVANKEPAVVPAPGGYLVFWTREVSDVSADVFYQRSTVVSSTIVGQRFTAAGRPIGEELLLSEDGLAGSPQAASLADGRRVAVVWHAEGDGSDGVYARLVTPGGTATAPFRVDDGLGEARRPSLAAAPDGGFLVTWDACCDAADDRGIFARSYAADAAPASGAFAVAARSEGDQTRPVVAPLGAGGYLVAWYGPSPGGDVWDQQIYAQALGAAGEHLGSEVAVSRGGPGRAHTAPAIASTSDGGVLVGWTAWRGWFQWAIFGRELTATGQMVPGITRLSHGPLNGQRRFALVGTADGGHFGAWAGFDSRGEAAITTEVLRLRVPVADQPAEASAVH